MHWLRYLIVLICFLSVGCSNETNSATPEATQTPIGLGPAVISNNPTIIVQSWEYIGPRSPDALVSFPSRNPEAIAFGPDHYEAYIIWRESGFDLIWGNVFCSTEPILIIKEATIELWLNDGIWNDCEASQEIHAFNVELETDIPPEKWTYILHKDAPP